MKDILHIPRQIFILFVVITLLIFGRIIFSGSQYYLFLFWNIFLAFVPFVISRIVALIAKKEDSKYLGVLIAGAFLWLITFPNAPYLVTDVIHLGHNRLMPVWYDAILLFLTAWVGMLFTFYSLSNIEKSLRTKFSQIKTEVILGLAILLSSFGIYLGRFLRWNSWDVITNPTELTFDILDIFMHPSRHGEAFGFTIVMLIFISVSYYAWKSGHENK